MSTPPESAPSAPGAFLSELIGREKQRFVDGASLLSFSEYLDIVAARPGAQTRDAAAYVRDAIASFGTYPVERPYGAFTRFSVFDSPFDDGRDPVVGQEEVQRRVQGLLTDFIRGGRVNRLVLLTGPNGSAKSSFVACMMRGLEHYSRQPEGALYTFNWVFPSSRLDRGSIGFGSVRSLDAMTSFAHLKEGDVDARIRCETRDHPLLLLPSAERVAFLRTLLGEDAALPDALSKGELSPKARRIFDALMRAYQGDLGEVLKHVQVERFTVSRRYRHAAVTIDPQLRVDAGVRQVTGDRSLSSLPPSLQNVPLFEPVGDLVDANRGIIEYNDLLKRPLEAFKYLLSTCETGAVRLDTMTLHLDAVMLGSCNADRLTAFKAAPDFASFQARLELVEMPYLVDYTLEASIYDRLLETLRSKVSIGPHVAEVLALWAVLCRVERPLERKGLPEGVAQALTKMTPLAKAMLYAHGHVPDGLARDVGNSLLALVPELYTERAASEHYEGRFGPSPRTLKALLLSAARGSANCLTGLGVIAALGELVEQTSVHPFLRLEPDGAWHNPRKAIDLVRAWYLDRVEDELHRAMGLVDRGATGDLFARYIDHTVHTIRGEKRINPVTGRAEDPDATLMRDVEKRLGVAPDDAADFRTGVVHRIAAWRMDHPDDALDFGEIFQDHVSRLNDSFYEAKRKQSDRIKRDLLTELVDEGGRLDANARAQVQQTISTLEQDFGFARPCAVEVIGYLLRLRAESS